MPYGAEVKKLDTVYLDGKLEIAALPEVMKMLDLKPGQTVDDETAKQIVAENDRLVRVKN
jgi:hypothetical protein